MVYSILYLILIFPNAIFSISTRQEQSIDVIFIIDGSAHTADLLFKQELLLIPKIISKLLYKHEKIRFGLITYSDRATLQMRLGYVKNNKALLQKLWRIKHSESGQASLCYALRLARTYLFQKSSNRQRFLIVFPNTMWNLQSSTRTENNLLKEMNVKILMIMLGDDIDRGMVTKIADVASVIYRPHITLNFVQKNYIYNFIVNNIYQGSSNATHLPSNQTIQTSTSTKPTTQSNLPTVNVLAQTMTVPGVTDISSTESWTAGITTIMKDQTVKLPPGCNINGHLVLVIDGTSCVSANGFQRILEACIDIINSIVKANLDTDIAIVSFGSETIINLTFEDYRTIKDINKYIHNFKQQGGVSGLGSALSTIDQKILYRKNMNNYKYYIVIFSASKPISGPDPIIIKDVMLRSGHFKIWLVSIGNATSSWIDQKLSNQRIIDVTDFDNLHDSMNRIFFGLCET